MSVASKHHLNQWVIKKGISFVLRRYFSAVHVCAATAIGRLGDVPTIYYANHTAGWDAVIALLLSSQSSTFDAYILVAQHIVNSYPFVKWVGVLSVNQSNTLESAQTILDSVKLIRGHSDRSLWIFPQGQIRPYLERPLHFERGLATVVRYTRHVRVIPVGLHYTFGLSPGAQAYVTIGSPQIFDGEISLSTEDLTRELETSLTLLLNDMDDKLAHAKTDEFITVWRSRSDIALLPLRLMQKRSATAGKR